MSIAVGEKPVRYLTAPLPLPDEIYTAEDLLGFPSDWHYELIEGYLRPMPMPTGNPHGRYTALMTLFLMQHIVEKAAGDCFAAESGFLTRRNPDTVKAPDFAFIRKERLTVPQGNGFTTIIPDLVLETRSPSDREAAVQEKVQEWLAAGVQVVLDLDPARETVTVYRANQDPLILSAGDSFTAEEILPGFSLPLRKVFPVQ